MASYHEVGLSVEQFLTIPFCTTATRPAQSSVGVRSGRSAARGWPTRVTEAERLGTERRLLALRGGFSAYRQGLWVANASDGCISARPALVVAAVLGPAQAIRDNRGRLSIANGPRDTAHRLPSGSCRSDSRARSRILVVPQ